MVKPKENLTDAQMVVVEEIYSATEFIKKYYPGFWDRVKEDDILHLVTLSRVLFKTHPEYLEANFKRREGPTQ